MARDYDFFTLLVSLLVLALQIHNPFQGSPPSSCRCECSSDNVLASGGGGSGAVKGRSAESSRPSTQQQPQQSAPAYRKAREAQPSSPYASTSAAAPPGAGAGLSTDALLRELDSIQAKAKVQQETLAAAGRMPPPSQILDHLREGDQAAGVVVGRVPGERSSAQQQLPLQMPPSGGSSYSVDYGVPRGGSEMAVAGASIPGSVLARQSDMGRFLEAHQPRGLGVVLGVGRGDFALRLLSGWVSTSGVFLVDPYIHVWRGYNDPANLDDREHQMVYEGMREKLQQYEGKHVLVRDFSHSFAATYRSGGVGVGAPTFVYVDANHAEKAVARDLELWWPLLASGGIMAGSTYMNDASGNIQVRTAVDAFVGRHQLQLHLTVDESPAPTWFFEKP